MATKWIEQDEEFSQCCTPWHSIARCASNWSPLFHPSPAISFACRSLGFVLAISSLFLVYTKQRRAHLSVPNVVRIMRQNLRHDVIE